MPLTSELISHHTTTIDIATEDRIRRVFSLIDDRVDALARNRGLLPSQVKLLQPLHYSVLVCDEYIYVSLAVHELGGVATRDYVNWSDQTMDMETANLLAERRLGFKETFGILFSRSILEQDGEEQEEAANQIAQNYIEEEVKSIERDQRIVRIHPIFQGRDFLLDQQLVFVLSPLAEPFDTIFRDHLKPTVESLQMLRCLRANDIYDNRPIIEDIWKCTNEARVLIAELTGRNANVFYETGIAHTVGKEVILITQSMDDVPFDLKHLRCIVYDYTPRGIKILEENLKNTIAGVLDRSH